MNGSVLKLNSVRDPMRPQPLAGYRELLIARDGITAPTELVDPDGNRIVLVPRGHDGVTGIGVRLAVRDERAAHRFFGDALGLAPAGANAYRCGDSLLMFAADASAWPSGR